MKRMVATTSFIAALRGYGSRSAQARQLIHRKPRPAIAGHHVCAAERPPRPVSAGPTNKAAEGRMTVAQQAFIFNGEIFVLSFVAIYAVWFADRLLRNFLR